jgi:hypothetical protein
VIYASAGSQSTPLKSIKNKVIPDEIFANRHQEKPVSILTAESAPESSSTDAFSFQSNDSQNSDTESPDNEYEDDEGDDWLETTLLAAAGGDLELAATLISTLPRELMLATRAKGNSGQNTAAGGTGIPCERQHGDLTGPTGGVSTSQRKRKKISESDSRTNANEEDGEEEEDKGSNDGNNFGQEVSEGAPNLLACPFHKLDSIKYGIHSTHLNGGGNTRDYRTCAGPGFKTIQRFKCVSPSNVHLRYPNSPFQGAPKTQPLSCAMRPVLRNFRGA